MEPGIPDISISDVVLSTAGRDRCQLFYCVGTDDQFVWLADGKGRTLDKPKRKKRKHVQKVLRAETRVALKLRNSDKVLNSELRRDLAFLIREIQSMT